MKRAFLVFGPESSGTRLMTRIFVGVDCAGSYGREQPWDDETPDEDLIVWRRSFPHRGEWPDVSEMIDLLTEEGYEASPIVMSRDWHCTARSQVNNHRPKSMEEAIENIRQAYLYIFDAIDGLPYEIVNYEALVLRPTPTVNALFGRLGLPTLGGVDVRDENAKYYEVQ